MNALLDLPRGKVVLVLAPYGAQTIMVELAAALARSGALRVLDGGNLFNVYLLARALRRQRVDVSLGLERVALARAFTCYQMEAMLEITPAQPVPTLVLDPLSTFYDESVPLRERQRLLKRGVQHLRRLSDTAPVAVSATPLDPRKVSAAKSERTGLLSILQDAADQVMETESPAPLPLPPRLF